MVMTSSILSLEEQQPKKKTQKKNRNKTQAKKDKQAKNWR